MSRNAVTWAWQQDVPSTSKFVLVRLAEDADDEGMASPGEKALETWTGLNRRTVQRALNHLEDILLIRGSQGNTGRGFTVSYQLMVERAAHDRPSDEPPDDHPSDYHAILLSISDNVPSKDKCDAYLDKKGIAFDHAEMVATQMSSRIIYDEKKRKWVYEGTKGKVYYTKIWRVFQVWCASEPIGGQGEEDKIFKSRGGRGYY